MKSIHYLDALPVLILFPHSRCNCRCVMCDIWKVTDVEELSTEELASHAEEIEGLGIEWVVFSGGEPLMHSDLFGLAKLLKGMGIRSSLLTTGLLLEKNANHIVDCIDDVIVSLDGPAALHNEIRRIPGAFESLREGVRALKNQGPAYPVSARCTVQRANHVHLRQTVESARELGLESVSFLAADVTSEAFNRAGGWSLQRQTDVSLNSEAVDALEREVDALISDHASDIETGFIRETPEKLRRIVRSFRVCLGLEEPMAPRCNAPWTSAVIESDGTLRPCFFHAPIGNVREQGLREALNSPEAISFRSSLNVSANETCRRCTCSLYWRG